MRLTCSLGCAGVLPDKLFGGLGLPPGLPPTIQSRSARSVQSCGQPPTFPTSLPRRLPSSQGDGAVLLRDGGLPAGAFVGEYLGELYAAWRWLERDNRTRE